MEYNRKVLFKTIASQHSVDTELFKDVKSVLEELNVTIPKEDVIEGRESYIINTEQKDVGEHSKGCSTKNEKESIAIGLLFALSCLAVLGATHKGKSAGFVVGVCVLSLMSLCLIGRGLQLNKNSSLTLIRNK